MLNAEPTIPETELAEVAGSTLAPLSVSQDARAESEPQVPAASDNASKSDIHVLLGASSGFIHLADQIGLLVMWILAGNASSTPSRAPSQATSVMSHSYSYYGTDAFTVKANDSPADGTCSLLVTWKDGTIHRFTVPSAHKLLNTQASMRESLDPQLADLKLTRFTSGRKIDAFVKEMWPAYRNATVGSVELKNVIVLKIGPESGRAILDMVLPSAFCVNRHVFVREVEVWLEKEGFKLESAVRFDLEYSLMLDQKTKSYKLGCLRSATCDANPGREKG
jgi:hypothetical protein